MSTDSTSPETSSPGRKARVALVAMVMLSAVGFGIAAELTDVFYMTHTDPNFVSICAISPGANCQTVALSDYSTVAGAPVSVWAMAGYLFFAFLAIVAMTQRQTGFALGFLSLMGFLFLGVSIWLVILMSVIIRSICILCVAIDFVNVFILALCVMALGSVEGWILPGIQNDFRKLRTKPNWFLHWVALYIKAVQFVIVRWISMISNDFQRLFRKPLWLLLFAGAGLGILGGAWTGGSWLVKLAESDATFEGEPAQCGHNGKSNAGGNSLQMGVASDGRPWIGAANPVIEVDEFTDYECPYCRRAHRAIRQQLSKYPDKLRVYHRHFPLDNACNKSVKRPFHRKACEMSRMAICAQQQGRFWEMNDYLFENSASFVRGEATNADIAERLELDVDKFSCCMADSSVDDVIKKDTADGIAAGVEGTPSFLINGQLHVGSIPPAVLKKLDP